MLREINQQELEIILSNLQLLIYFKKNEKILHELFPNGVTTPDDFNLEDAIYEFRHKEDPFLKNILRCECDVIEPYYDENFFANKMVKYQDYATNYPKYSTYYRYDLDYDYYASGESANDGYNMQEVVLYSETFNKFFDLYFENVEKMRVVNKTLSRLRNIFCAKSDGYYDNEYACHCFCIINTEEYAEDDYIANEYKNISKYVICYFYAQDNDRFSNINSYIYYLKEIQEMFDYIEAEVSKVETVCN